MSFVAESQRASQSQIQTAVDGRSKVEPSCRRRIALLAAAMAALAPVLLQPVSAETVYWDTNGATPGSGNTDLEVWDQGGTANWSLNSAGDGEPRVFNAGDAAVFSAGTDHIGTAVIAVADFVQPSSITFNSQLTNFTVQGMDTSSGFDFGTTKGVFNSSAAGFTATGKQFKILAALKGSAGITIAAHGSLTTSSSYFQLGGNSSGLTGGITITSGLVDALNANALGSNTVTIADQGGFLDANHGLTLSNNFVLSGGTGTIRTYGSVSTIFNGTVSGPGNLNFTDGGGRIFTANNTLTGAVTISGGNIQLGNDTTSGSFASASSLNIAGGTILRVRRSGSVNLNTLIPSNLTFNGTIEQRGNARTDELVFSSPLGVTNTGTIRAQDSTITIAPGALVESNTTHVYGGTLKITGGTYNTTFTYMTATAPDTANAVVGTIDISGGTFNTRYLSMGEGINTSGIVNQSGGTVNLLSGSTGFRLGHWNNGALTPAGSYNLTGGTLDATSLSANAAVNQFVSVGWDGAATMTVGGGANPATLKAYGIRIDNNGDTVAYNDTLTVANNGFVEIGAGAIASASVNDTLILSGGNLKATAAGTWSPATVVTAATTSTLNTNGNNITYSGVMAGSGTVNKTGAGTLYLSAATTGGTKLNVSGGTLAGVLNAGNLTVSAGGSVTPGAGISETAIGTLAVESLTLAGGELRMNLNATNTATGGGINDLIASTGPITVNGGMITPLFTGSPTTGTYTLATGSGITINTTPTVNANYSNSRLVYAVGATGNNLTLNISGTAANLLWSGGTNSTWDLNTSQNWQLATPNDEKFFAFDSVTFDQTGAAFPNVVMVGSLAPGVATVNATSNYTFSGAGSIISGTLNKAGTGALTLLNDNNLGATNVNDGRLLVGNGGTAGSIGNSSVAVNTPGVVAFNRSDNVSVNQTITGTGSIEQLGTGVLTLSGTGSYTGGTLISRGTVQLAGASAAGTGTITLGDANTGANNISLLSSREATTFANPIIVSAAGTGTVTIGSNGGSAAGGTNYSGQITFNRPTTIQGMNTDKTLLSGKLTGNVGMLTVIGGRRVSIRSTANDFTGNIDIVGAGTVVQTSENSASEVIPNTASVNVGTGATFQLAGTAATTETIANLTGSGTVTRNVAGLQTLALSGGSFSGIIQNGTGIVGITKYDTGTLLLNGVNTATGAVTVNGGTLGGTGTIAGATTVNRSGNLAPGGAAGPGTFSIAAPLTFGTGSTGDLPKLTIELGTGTTSDRVVLTGATAAGLLTLSDPDQLNLVPLRDITSTTTYTIATFASSTGAFDTVLVNGLPTQNLSASAANYVLVNYNPTNITVSVNNLVSAVPEPGTALLAMAGFGLLTMRRRKRLA